MQDKGNVDLQDQRRRRRYRGFAIAVGCLMFLLGMSALVGWLLQIEVIISLVPGFPSMAFNTALCFVLSGLGLAASTLAARRFLIAATIMSGFAAAIAAARLVEIVTIGRTFHNIDLLISRFVIPPDFIAQIGGGMGPNTALVFLIANLSLLLSLHIEGKSQVVQELTSYVVITLGMIALASYVTDAEQGYRWGSYAAMALHTAVGMVIFGSGLLARSWWMQPANRAQIPLWIPAAVCFTGLLVDLYTPLGVANGILYVPLVLTALWFGNRNAPLFFAFACTVLLMLGFFAVRHDEAAFWQEIANRTITAATLWLIAILVFYFMRNNHNLETERVRFGALVRGTPDAVIVIDEGGTIRSYNPAAESMFGYSPQETIGRNIKMLMPEPYHSEHDGYLAHYRKTGEERIIGTTRMVSGRRKNGIVFPIDVSISAVATGDAKIFVGIVRDISERARQEERMKTTLAQLEAYTAELERSNHDLDEFAYIASHDLKEPLRGLHNHSRFLLEDYEDKLDDDGVRRLNRLVRLSQRMEKLVNDLLYFSRLGRQQLAVKRSDIGLIVKDVVATMELLLEERHAKVVIDGQLPDVVCDAPRLTEVFRNLITNAIKYNDKPAPLVSIGYLERYVGKDGTVARNVFFVRDNGKGIPQEFHEDIFRIFKRLEKSQDSDDGTGAGLTFVRKIIARHNGDIWLESEVGTGTTFYFTLGKKREGQNAAA
ncbi:PAS domain-containing sensor histidine kinase [Rhizobium leguminosarum bv. trifolii]|uniref:Sensor protein FixL n=1 Tax=Rhizobium leguminosarum bv. trifolii TaxID=386 RepID=A0A3E1BXA6_RHILT|nr:sensor histidine kinase protein [Rhizobium sp. N324]OYD02673.1 sensor histidine kinase protein [Rhizobium sp. N4311]RFB98708.1 PAS domain-containing sensor histidine kinase [Rhizobium leguminosarum bv. trifolii]RFB99582.1 PAS domain-containing sensor histidine kinase [Rhizobium leguminosarum bv. trifolii]